MKGERECPKCGASGEQWCVSSVGTPLPVPHSVRAEADFPNRRPAMTDVSKELLPCDHKNAQMHYDHHSCLDCGAYMPDATGRRGTAAVHGEWFPSEDAFEHFKSTGVRAWNTRAQPAPADVVEAAGRETYNQGYRDGFVDHWVRENGVWPDDDGESLLKGLDSTSRADGWQNYRDTFLAALSAMGVSGEVAEDDWLVRQLEAWPTRVDPEKTTSIEYLMKAAAGRIRQALNSAPETR
jgi:hypothetical protein